MCHGCQCFDQSTWCLQLKMPQAGQRLDRNSTRTTSAWCLTAWPPTRKRTSTLIQPHVPTREIKRERERERRGSAHFNFPRHLDPAPTVPAFYTRFQERSLTIIIICRYVPCSVFRVRSAIALGRNPGEKEGIGKQIAHGLLFVALSKCKQRVSSCFTFGRQTVRVIPRMLWAWLHPKRHFGVLLRISDTGKRCEGK